METQSVNNSLAANGYVLEAPKTNGIDYVLKFFSKDDIISAFEKIIEFKNFFQENRSINLEDQMAGLKVHTGKKSFLVFKQNKYITVPTENIAFFYIKYESPVIMCFDQQEYFVNYSLDQI